MGASRSTERVPGWLLIPVLLLLLVGFVISLYLGHLYLEVKSQDPATVQSFCAVSEGFDCVTVASSEYSVFLGIPIAFYGVEFFGSCLLLVLLSWRSIIGIKRWPSLVFDAMLVGLPVCAVLGWIAVTHIQSVCLLCATIYATVVTSVVLLGAVNRKRLVTFAREGPEEVLSDIRKSGRLPVYAVGCVAVLSQFYWLPRMTEGEGVASAAAPHKPKPDPSRADRPPAHSEEWLGQPIEGLTMGPADAPIQIEEFTDFQCPFCGMAHDVMIEVLKRYPGKIRLTHRDFPLDQACNPAIPKAFHPHACQAAYFARCAAKLECYWAYEGVLFGNQKRLGDEAFLIEKGEGIGMVREELVACVGDPETHAAVLTDIKEGISRGIRGTPTFFVNGESFSGVRPIEFWDEKIKTLLQDTSAPASSP